MMYFTFLLFLALFLPSKSVAESPKGPTSMHELAAGRLADTTEREVQLIDIKNQKATKVQRDAEGKLKLLPERLYRRYEPELKRYVFDLTDNKGKFQTPSRYLLPLSDFPAEWAGGDKGKVYVFDGAPKTGWDIWREIDVKESRKKYMVWVFSDPPEEKMFYHSLPNN